jgi:NAD(P)-dependent dehydrogenase (short-subunit alcohol dehydrogenase family)
VPDPVPFSDPRSLFDLTGRTAIVTGGSRGIGRAMAMGLAAAGAAVVVASRKADACTAVAAEIAAAGGQSLAMPTHVGRPDEITHLVEATVERFGGIDILVNNAANPLGGMLTEVTAAAFDASYGVNVKGPMLLGAAAIEHLAASGHGSVINVISAGAFRPGEGLGLYCSGKAALWNLTRVMAKEWAPRSVRVNALAPGPFRTDMMADALAIPDFYDRIVESTLQKRVAEPEEIVGAALFLASDASSYMTGSALGIDGGTLA